MKIESIAFRGFNVTPKTNWCFVEVRTEDGLVGLGECTLGNHEPLMAAEVSRLEANWRGADARDRNRIARLLPHAPGGLVTHTAISALDQALCDLAAQRNGEPLHRLLGGAVQETVRLYANINRGANPRTPEGFAQAARRAVAEGFTGVKLAPFEPMVWEDGRTPANRAAYAEGLFRIAAVRAAIGPDVDLMVDAHWRFSPGGAAQLIRDVSAENLFWLECPVAEANHREITRLRGLANARGMRLAGAESLSGLAAYRPLVEAGCYDVLMPDAKHAGGLEEILRIAALAQTAGVEIAPHNPTGPVCHAHSVHLCASIPNFLVLEVQYGETEAFFDIVQGGSLRFVQGTAPLSQAAGLGIALNPGDFPAWKRMDRPWLDPRLG
ncbi:mandelate racemase/muconate lactonizing enzyme family protein [Roseomonas frigidaquae]|uniref:Mandelate racemase/muconate lactonizing enzyme family protein n=1 Tax=Falsiroseomonas frigidaquae TaxID=487318 RepID=A0ABX1EWV3_9PROT|nr:mandelate racemase/muconate lactonizing enzyme family protein [Falsiroseomonas frigidaquae]NKE44555.1 mandelate racemase/muconate lactonizing enzyme family protein [Falsiroseomonas frigidaquae]